VTIDLALVGFGNVARRFVRLLEERRDVLRVRHDLECRVVGIATRRHGSSLDPGGLDPLAAAAAVEGGGRLGDGLGSGGDGQAFIRDVAGDWRRSGAVNPLVVVETTVLDVRSGQPAIDHVRAALSAGAHVVTANKGPVAFAYDELRGMAEAAGRRFLFEGAVMDGIPVFNLARRTLPAVQVAGFRGVLNSTTNYIISAMEDGREFAEALAEMQAAGIAEADASLDVDGWDAAAKAAALANVLLDARITPLEVERTGIGGLDGTTVRGAVARGKRVKLVARGRRDTGGGLRVAVAPEELSEGDLLAGLRGQQNAVVLETDLLQDVAIVQLGGGLVQTAYALVSDLVALRSALPAPL
jgi:homoserine dehydrogenase